MESAKLEILHEHYRDTCSMQSGQLRSRDHYFLAIVALLAIMLFDMSAPQGFDSAVGDFLKAKVGLSSSPDLDFIRSLLWFLLLGATVRYGQMAVNAERLYKSVHSLEALLDAQIPGGFEREGKAYKRFRPPFVAWARVVYTWVFPLLLAGIALLWLWWQSPNTSWPLRQWFNTGCAVCIITTVVLFLHAFHRYKVTPTEVRATHVPTALEPAVDVGATDSVMASAESPAGGNGAGSRDGRQGDSAQ